MPRRPLSLICGVVILFAGCTALDGDGAPPENLLPLDSLPADYGELVTVLHYQQGDGPLVWDELWFENEETGVVTRVPVYRPTWSYDPARVRRIGRTPAATPTGG